MDPGMGPIEGADDELMFAPDDQAVVAESAWWKVLIVDDEREVHAVTELALRNFSFEGRSLHFFHAYSGAEALRIMAEQPDIAVILLDVVMETDDAGLVVAKRIRTELDNQSVRIILRTGQAGLAPEREVIVAYEISDYKTKTELTAQRLFTTLVCSLRSFRDLAIIEGARRGLEKIVASIGTALTRRSLEQFIDGVLIQLTALLHVQRGAMFCRASPTGATGAVGALMVYAGTASYGDCRGRRAQEALPDPAYTDLQETVRLSSSYYGKDRCIVHFRPGSGSDNAIFLDGVGHLQSHDRRLLERFCANAAIAIDGLT